jgi:hypothetical protein
MRASPEQARNYLHAALAAGVIAAFEQLEGGRWLITTTPTRLEHYRDADAHGTIVLRTREVLAFTEGWWAGRGVRPIRRAGDRD